MFFDLLEGVRLFCFGLPASSTSFSVLSSAVAVAAAAFLFLYRKVNKIILVETKEKIPSR